MSTTRTRAVLFILLVAIVATAVGCGSSGLGRTSNKAATSTAQRTHAVKAIHFVADQPIAAVGAVTITRGQLRHWVAIGNREQLGAPEPPDYTECVKFSRAPGTPATPETTERLKDACERQYDELSKPALSELIHTYWLIGEARDDGMITSGTLKGEGSLSRFALVAPQLSDRLYRKLERQVPTVTSAQVAAYYQHHKSQFHVPELRDLYILRRPDYPSAKKARQEIEGGASFAEVVGKSSTLQPPSTRGGLQRELGPNQYGEPVLNRAIFKAHLRALSGPVEISLGYYIFEVLKRTPPHQKGLAEASHEIVVQLRKASRDRILSRFVKAFRRRWTSSTSCTPHYVVKFCKEYRPSEAEARESMTTL